MIVTQAEIAALEKMLERERQVFLGSVGGLDKEVSPTKAMHDFLAARPHLLMLLGFDEFRPVLTETRSRMCRPEPPLVPGFDHFESRHSQELFFRQRKSGAWCWFHGIGTQDPDFDERTPQAPQFWLSENTLCLYDADRWLNNLRRTAEAPVLETHTLISPGLWTPESQLEQRIALSETVPSLLREVYKERQSLREIHWRDLEELVAELLRLRGLDITVTARTRDGGRDIVARGELIPGEPSVLAVEVKQKTKVGLADVQRALQRKGGRP